MIFPIQEGQHTEGLSRGRQSKPLGFLLELRRDSLSVLELITVMHVSFFSRLWSGREGEDLIKYMQ